jgi:hypothetical protein
VRGRRQDAGRDQDEREDDVAAHRQ